MPEFRGSKDSGQLKGYGLLEGRGRKKHRENSAQLNQFPPRKRSIPYGFDFDLDEVWAPLNPHLKHVYNKNNNGEAPGSKNHGRNEVSAKTNTLSSNRNSTATSEQSLRRSEPGTADSGEFETEGDIFQQIAGLSSSLECSSLEDPVQRDVFGREVGRRDSLDSTGAGHTDTSAVSATSSPFSTMTRMQISPISTASSRHSYDAVRRQRSYSSGGGSQLSLKSVGSRHRRLSAGSIMSTQSRNQSPGRTKRVGNSANCLTPGLGASGKLKKRGSNGSSPVRGSM